MTMSKLKWYLRQLIPTTYRSHYRTASGQLRFSVWRMWMGRSFDAEDVGVIEME